MRQVIGTQLPGFIYDLCGKFGTHAIAAGERLPCVVLDASPLVVESVYRNAKAAGWDSILPLIGGPDGYSRFSTRRRADLVIALDILDSLQHLSLVKIAKVLRDLGRMCVLELVHPTYGAPTGGHAACSLEQLLTAFENQFCLIRIATQAGARRQLLLLKSIHG